MAGITTFHNPFHTPWNLYAATDDRVPWVYPVSIAGHPFIMDFKKSQILTMQVRRQSSDESVEPGEQTLSAAGVWPRAQDNWFLGAGQYFLDNRFAFESVYVHSGEYPSVRTRYWRSLGVNPWTEGSLTLHNEYVQGYQDAYAGTSGPTGPMRAIVCGAFFYITDGKTLKFTTSAPTASTTWTTVTSANVYSITSLTTDGTRVWFTTSHEGVYVTTGGSTTSSAASTPPALNGIGGALAYDAGAGTVNATNLPNGAMTYYISEVDAFGNETAAVSVAHTVASLPVNLNWNPDTNATTFKVRRNIGGSDLLIYNGTDPSFVDDGTVAGTVSAHPTANGTGSTAYKAVWLLYAKGHLLASTGRDLVEILADGSTSFIYQHENPGFVFSSGCDTPTAIIVGGYAGYATTSAAGVSPFVQGYGGTNYSGVSFIGAIQPDSATNGATLAPPTWATTLPDGEMVYALAYNAGAMVLGTSVGLRTGTKPDAIGTFDVNPVITALGPVTDIACYGQYAYFSFLSWLPSETWRTRDFVTGLGRADLSQYTTPGVPAYATDVSFSNGANGNDQWCSIALYNGTPYFTIGSYLVVPSGKVRQSGWLETGWIRYGTLENKILVEADFQTSPLPAGTAVEYEVVLDDEVTIANLGMNESAGSTRAAEYLDTGLATGRGFMPIITLYSDPAQANTPTLRNHVTKAMVTTKRQDEILLNLVWKEQMEGVGPSQQTVSMDCFAEYLFLKDLEASGAPVTLQMGNWSRQAYIDQILDKPEDMTGDRAWFQGDLTVKLVTLT